MVTHTHPLLTANLVQQNSHKNNCQFCEKCTHNSQNWYNNVLWYRTSLCDRNKIYQLIPNFVKNFGLFPNIPVTSPSNFPRREAKKRPSSRTNADPLTRDGPTPTNISRNSEPDTVMNGTFASPAVAFASSVLPVPGGPVRIAPFGIFAPSSSYCAGFLRKLTNSMISSFASSQPATSLPQRRRRWRRAAVTAAI